MKRITFLSMAASLFYAVASFSSTSVQAGFPGAFRPGSSGQQHFGGGFHSGPRSPIGSFSGGHSGRDHSFSGSMKGNQFQVSGRQGNQNGYAGGTFNGRNSTFSGGYTNQNGTTTGYRNRQGIGFNQRNADGSTRGGSISGNWNRFNGQGHNFDAAGNGYAGGISRDGKRVGVNGEYRTPGYIPGTQNRWTGNVDINGRNTRVGGGFGMYDATGRIRLAENKGTLDRQQLNMQQNMGVGNFGMNQSANVKFGGRNSSVSASREINAGGLASQKMGGSVNKQGAKANASMSVGGAKVEAKASVSTSGSSFSVGGAKISL